MISYVTSILICNCVGMGWMFGVTGLYVNDIIAEVFNSLFDLEQSTVPGKMYCNLSTQAVATACNIISFHFFFVVKEQENDGNKKEITPKPNSEKLKNRLRSQLSWIREDIRERKWSRIVFLAGNLTHLGVPALMGTYVVVSPCAIPMFLRSTLSDCPRLGNFPQLPSSPANKIVFTVMDYSLVFYIFGQAVWQIVYTFYCAVVSVLNNLKR